MKRRLQISAAVLVCALLHASPGHANPPHGPIDFHTWVRAGMLFGKPLLVRRNSIRLSRHIYTVTYSDDGYKDSDGWHPDGNLSREEIDCKYHTSHDIWAKPIGGGLYSSPKGEWDRITPNSDEAILENYLCTSARKGA